MCLECGYLHGEHWHVYLELDCGFISIMIVGVGRDHHT